MCRTGPASFTVAADGSPTYQWRHNGDPIPGATDATYTIAAVGSVNGGMYDCVLTNGCGSATSDSAVLTFCPVDFNCLGGVTVGDLFTYLSAWFDGDARADWNASGTIEVQDIFDFLNAWFVGCA
jgi:hypothetical protein